MKIQLSDFFPKSNVKIQWSKCLHVAFQWKQNTAKVNNIICRIWSEKWFRVHIKDGSKNFGLAISVYDEERGLVNLYYTSGQLKTKNWNQFEKKILVTVY